MPIELTWYGHGSWLIKAGGHRLLLDPFLDDSPAAPIGSNDVQADTILVSHGHFDHVADVASIANRTGAQVIANFEIADWFAKNHDVAKTVGMNIGGKLMLDSLAIKMTHAIHSSQLPDGSYGGNPGGFLLDYQGHKVYFACDTALFSDMSLIGAAGVNVAVLPIGDLFTMGPEDSIEAIKLIQPIQVLPAHYNTWPLIEQDAQAWAYLVRTQTKAEPVVLEPGQSHKL